MAIESRIVEEYKKYEPIFGAWYINKLIGKGSFGNVFEISRKEFGMEYKAALKVISVPQDEEEVKARMTEGTGIESISRYYEGILKEIVNENMLMSKLKGNSNIVSYEDHQIIPHENGIGYDVLIRMELLTPLIDLMLKRKLTEQEVVKLGIDMCKALELCHRKNIIHRDIKPQNIFVADSGEFKLGDFGIARTMEKTSGNMSKKGTYKYMAPEVFRGDPYDSTVDLYSLGIVLFSLMNGNRGPFLPPPPATVTHTQEEDARMRRFRGEPIPAPQEASTMFAYIIQKACDPDPQKRYRTAGQMKRDLENYLRNYEQGEAGATGKMAQTQQRFTSKQVTQNPAQYGPQRQTQNAPQKAAQPAAKSAPQKPAQGTQGTHGTQGRPQYPPHYFPQGTAGTAQRPAQGTAGTAQRPPQKQQPGTAQRPVQGAPQRGMQHTQQISQLHAGPYVAPAMQAPPQNSAAADYTKLGGWLGFFAYVSLVGGIFSGIYALIVIIALINQAGYYDVGPVLYAIFTLLTLLLAMYIAVGMFVRIRRKNTKFLVFYEKMALISLGFQLIMLLIFSAALGSAEPLLTSGPAALGSVFGYAVWILYFAKSVRVRTYFGTDSYFDKSIFCKKARRPVPAVPDRRTVKQR